MRRVPSRTDEMMNEYGSQLLKWRARVCGGCGIALLIAPLLISPILLLFDAPAMAVLVAEIASIWLGLPLGFLLTVISFGQYQFLRGCQACQDVRAPILLLRSFRSPLTQGPDVYVHGHGEYPGSWEKGNSFEFQIVKGAQESGHMIAVGRKSVHFGDIRLSFWHKVVFYEPLNEAGKDWQEVVQLLFEAASVIILIPDTSPGIVYEVEALKELKLFGKVLFFMPPSKMDDSFGISSTGLEEHWEQVREDWNKRGIGQLPRYDESGMIFRTRPNLSVERVWQDATVQGMTRNAVEESLHAGQPFVETAKQLRDFGEFPPRWRLGELLKL